jgi:hypothetical protein
MVAALLKCANIPGNSETQSQLREKLLNASRYYRFATAQQHQIPQKAYNKAATAAKALLNAMDELNRYARPRVKPRAGPDGLEIDTDELDWLKESDRHDAQCCVKKVLAAVERGSPDFTGSPRRGQPPKRAKAIVVAQALIYLENYAPGSALRNWPAKMRLSNKYLEFVELFYETATGEEDARGKLEWQIREWLERQRRFQKSMERR